MGKRLAMMRAIVGQTVSKSLDLNGGLLADNNLDLDFDASS